MGLASSRKPSASPSDVRTPGHGRHAEAPHDLPPKGWLDILSRTAERVSVDNATVVAAGVAFYAFVAVVPALAALIGIYGLVANPTMVGNHIAAFARILPREVMPLIEQQLKRITENTHAASVSTIVGLLVTLYSSASATKALIQGLNICYDEREKRNFLKLNAFALLLTLCGIVGSLIAVTLVAGVPPLLNHLDLGETLNIVVSATRWAILVAGFVLGLAMIYRYGPSRREAKWRWVSWGAALATLLWLAGSWLFSFYVSTVGSYDRMYGSLGAVVVFLMWMYLSAFAVLVGAELNAEMERQTLKDTTEGPPKPLGQRGARAADTVGPTRDEPPAGDAAARPVSSRADDRVRPPKKSRHEP